MVRHSFFSFLSTLLLSFFIFFSILFTKDSFAIPPQAFILSSLDLNKNDKGYFVTLSLSVDNEDGLRDLLRDGAVADLSITLTTNRNRSWWADSEVASMQYDFLFRHIALTREFEVTTKDQEGNQVVTRDKNFTRLLFATCGKLHLEAISYDTLYREPVNRDYSTTISISLTHKEVPPWLEKSSLFWSAEIVPSEKRVKTFHY